MTLIAACGAVGFFVYSQLRWRQWNIYMLTQAADWGIVPDYLAVFKPGSYRWLVPALNNPTEASQISMTLGALLLVGIAAVALLSAAGLCVQGWYVWNFMRGNWVA